MIQEEQSEDPKDMGNGQPSTGFDKGGLDELNVGESGQVEREDTNEKVWKMIRYICFICPSMIQILS